MEKEGLYQALKFILITDWHKQTHKFMRQSYTSVGRDKYNSSLTSADEYVEEDSSESLLLIDELCKLPLSAIVTYVIKLLRFPIICHRFNYL